jgi:phytol kinase
MISNSWIALGLTFVLSLAWLRANDFMAHRGWVSSDISRKIIHIGTGPLFVLCWLLFPDTPFSPYLAALVPLLITIQFLLVGLGIIKDEAAVRAMSRSGDRREILRGPLYYGVIFIALTLIFWKRTPTGIVALMLLCGGDGLADIIGRRVQSAALPWNPKKSLAGSLGMFFGGWLLALIVLGIYSFAGIMANTLISYIPPLTVIAIAATLVESLPLKEIDNLTISFTAVLIGMLLF